MSQRLKTVFMGTPELAVPSLRCLAEMTDLQCVVTQPDRPAGRGKQPKAPAVKQAAIELGIPVWQPETLKGQEQAEQLQDTDLFVVLAYGEILRQNILDLPRFDCINLHASLLPRWRGASPLQACLRARDGETGVSVMRMVKALDAGPVFYQESLPLAQYNTLPVLHDAIADCSASALAYYLKHRESLTAQDQDQQLVTYCGKLHSDDGHLDFTQSVQELDAWIRAYTPVPGCWVLAGGKRMRILAAQAIAEQMNLNPGQIVTRGARAFVGCADGVLELLRVQAAGKKAVAVKDYLNGYRFPDSFE